MRLTNLPRQCAKGIYAFYQLRIKNDPVVKSHYAWLNDTGNAQIKPRAYSFASDAVIMEVGGYTGQWAQEAFKLFGCNLHIFEPVPQYFFSLKQKFTGIPKVKLYNFGLSNRDTVAPLALKEEASSLFAKGKITTNVQLRDISRVISDIGLQKIDLLAINAEGAEYEILERLIQTRLVAIFQNILVQFHKILPNADIKRLKIIEALQTTHFSTYSYPFVWENFQLRADKK